MEPAIVAKDLSVIKNKKIILDKLSFSVSQGSVNGLIGPSGSGKTTLMRSLVGVQKYSGSLEVFAHKAGAKQLRKEIGYVTQESAVYDDLTVEQNLKYFGAIARVPRSDIVRTINEVHLESQAKQIVGSLSGGQRARVSLAIALLGKPKLLVLDEPTVGLDPILREDLWKLFTQLAASGRTLLVSSHVMDEAQRCDNIMLIRSGKLIWNDNRQRLLAETKTHDVGAAFIAMIEEEE